MHGLQDKGRVAQGLSLRHSASSQLTPLHFQDDGSYDGVIEKSTVAT
jgi:hypothetical protein